jgi:3-dehydroquinate dehydratase/shikimate dehydrogenase
MSSSLRNEPSICVSVAPRTAREATVLLGEADSSAANYIELRLDGLKDQPTSLKSAIRSMSKPLVLTYHDDPTLSLGSKISPNQLGELVEYAEYVDTEVEIPKNSSVRRIRSKHVWHSISLEQAEILVNEAWKSGCEIVKLAFKAQSFADNITALKLTSKLKVPNIVFCMGELGVLSRVLAPLYGSAWTYASLRAGLETAPGQVDVQTLRELYQALRGSS